MSVEKEKKPRKAPAKKAVASGEAAEQKPKAAAAKKAAAPKKTVAKSVGSKAAAKAVPSAETVKKAAPTHEQIAERAHAYFAARGYAHGFHEEDWLQAERELLEDM